MQGRQKVVKETSQKTQKVKTLGQNRELRDALLSLLVTASDFKEGLV